MPFGVCFLDFSVETSNWKTVFGLHRRGPIACATVHRDSGVHGICQVFCFFFFFVCFFAYCRFASFFDGFWPHVGSVLEHLSLHCAPNWGTGAIFEASFLAKKQFWNDFGIHGMGGHKELLFGGGGGGGGTRIGEGGGGRDRERIGTGGGGGGTVGCGPRTREELDTQSR